MATIITSRPAVSTFRATNPVQTAVPQWARVPVDRVGLAGLRLTRRGRVAVAVLSLFVAVPFFVVGGRADAGAPPAPLDVTVHTVAPGETLWGFAGALARPGEDVRDVVAQLTKLNGLDSGSLRVGQTIVIPKSGGGR
jgi:hypothetical protein